MTDAGRGARDAPEAETPEAETPEAETPEAETPEAEGPARDAADPLSTSREVISGGRC